MKSYGDVEEAPDGAGQPVSCCCDLGQGVQTSLQGPGGNDLVLRPWSVGLGME